MVRRTFCKVLLAVVVAVFSLVALSGDLFAQGHSDEGLKRAIAAQEKHTEVLMARDGVEGTGIGLDENGRPVIRVFTAGPEVRNIPGQLEGVPAQVVVTGKFFARADPTSWMRPAPIGFSTGHPDITAGTIGCRVYEDWNENEVRDDVEPVYALSNNHVYANSNDASIGDYVIQPGTSDGGSLPDGYIGWLSYFEPINFSGGDNTIDAAIAMSTTNDLGYATLDGYGAPSSTTATAFIGQKVQKYGRTTKLTNGEVSAINVTVDVCYDDRGRRCFKLAMFVNQIIIEPGAFSDGGDSGSLIVVDDSGAGDDLKAVGLLFAGSSTHTIANPIDLVLGAFGVTIDSEEPTPNEQPVVSITSPADGSIFDYGATIDFAGTASDTEDGDLTTNLVWTSSIDGPIGAGGSFSTTLSDGTHTITASVTDSGGKTGSASVSITVEAPAENEPPIVSITSPANDSTFDSGATIDFAGAASDTEDGDLTAGLAWTSSIDGSIGTGGSFSTTLSDGNHTITASVTDTGGKTGSASVSITVGAPPSEPTTVSVILPSGINGYATEGGRDGKKHLLITVALVDDLGGLVAAASVSIELFLDGSFHTSGTGTAGTDGTVTFKVANAPSGIYTTDVTNVTAEGLDWVGGTPDNSFTK